jgi:hypothetical protein
MATKTLSYLDLTPQQRRDGAKAARERLRQYMANPFLTPEQHEQLAAQMARIDQWEAGSLEVKLAR